MKFAKLALAALSLVASPALAATITTGTLVSGPEGQEVGTVVSVTGSTAVVDTGKHKVPLALDSFASSDKGPMIAVTRTQLDAMVDNQLAEMAASRDAVLVVGASVKTADNRELGTVAMVEGDNIVIDREDHTNARVTLLREHLDNGENGLMARLTLAQIDAAVSGGL